MRIYLAGPMRGYPDFNFPAFIAAAKQLRAAGHEVFNPAERDLDNGFSPDGTDGTEQDLADLKFDLRAALGADLAWICALADAVVVLPGWEKSRGATAEVAAARALGLPVHTVEDLAALVVVRQRDAARITSASPEAIVRRAVSVSRDVQTPGHYDSPHNPAATATAPHSPHPAPATRHRNEDQ